MLRKNLKRQVKLITCYPMISEKQTMIDSDMRLFRELGVKKVLATLIFHPLFQIFLRMFLEILEILVLEPLEDQKEVERTTEEMI